MKLKKSFRQTPQRAQPNTVYGKMCPEKYTRTNCLETCKMPVVRAGPPLTVGDADRHLPRVTEFAATFFY